MKIYTRQGDGGKTRLMSGERVSKSDPRIAAYGDIDELNSVLGALSASFPDEGCDQADDLHLIQSDLIHMSSWLARGGGSMRKPGLKAFGKEKTAFLEGAIDRLEKRLPELKEFLVPGGHSSAAWAHIARSVCRRAERGVVRMVEAAPERHRSKSIGNILAYLNRLSDYLFMLARWCNLRHGLSDKIGDSPNIR
jgi:cob(I)alamin adenosyltransferase